MLIASHGENGQTIDPRSVPNRAVLGAPCGHCGGSVLSACASGPDYRPPGAVSMGVPDRFFGAGVAGASAGELPLWWRRLNDLLLDVLIAAALMTLLLLCVCVCARVCTCVCACVCGCSGRSLPRVCRN